MLEALVAVLGAKVGVLRSAMRCSPASRCSAALGDLGFGNKRLVSLLSLPVRQDLKIQLEWELLIAAVLACCSCLMLALHGNQMKAESNARGVGRGGYWKGRCFGWQRAWEKKARNADLGEAEGWLEAEAVLQPPAQQSGALSAEGLPGQQPGWGHLLQNPPACARLGVRAGLAHLKPHPAELGLQE